MGVSIMKCAVYPKKYAHGFVVLCFVVVMQSFIMNSHEVFIHIHQGCYTGTGAIVRLPQCQWSKPNGYGKISQCITTTKHSKAKTVCIFLAIYCIPLLMLSFYWRKGYRSWLIICVDGINGIMLYCRPPCLLMWGVHPTEWSLYKADDTHILITINMCHYFIFCWRFRKGLYIICSWNIWKC